MGNECTALRNLNLQLASDVASCISFRHMTQLTKICYISFHILSWHSNTQLVKAVK